jgi:hypothetical protein
VLAQAEPTPPPESKSPKLIYPPPTSVDKKGKSFARIQSLGQLTQPYDTKMTREADVETHAFLGNWLVISGVVYDIRGLQAPDRTDRMLVFLASEGRNPTALLLFDGSKWRREIDMMRKDDRIEAYCSIDDISRLSVRLAHCELMQ